MLKCLHKGEIIDGVLLCVGCEQNLNKYVTENDLDKMFNGFDIIIDNEKVKVMNEKRNDLIEKLKRG